MYRYRWLPQQVSALTRSWPREWPWLALLVLAGSAAMSPNMVDPDLWGHVQYGREMFRSGLPTYTTHAYLASETRWINHEIVAELALAAVVALGGPTGLLLAKLLAAGALLTLLVVHMRKAAVSLVPCAVVLLLVAMGLARYWSCRPQLFSFMAYALLLHLLAEAFRGWEGAWQFYWRPACSHAQCEGLPRTVEEPLTYESHRLRWLWGVVPLMAVWTNTHGGFLAGLCVYGAYLVLRGAEAWSRRGAAAAGLLRRFALMIAVACFATLLNPYGWQFHVWLWHDLAVPRPEIVEWLPPNFTQPAAWPFLALIGLLVTTLASTRRSLDATHLVILVLTLWQAMSHERHIPFFALSVAFFLPRQVENVWQQLNARFTSSAQGTVSAQQITSAQPSASSPLTPALLALWLVAVGCVGYRLADRVAQLRVPAAEYPVAALEFMQRHALSGRMVCTMNWAQYVLAAFPEQISVQLDGRLRTAYSQRLIDTHFDFLYGQQSPRERYRDPRTPFEPDRVLREGYPDLVLLDRRQGHAEQVMLAAGREWVVLYQDGLAQLWGRATRYHDPASPDYLAASQRVLTTTFPTGDHAWPAWPRGRHAAGESRP
jgi:hypothetical protein